MNDERRAKISAYAQTRPRCSCGSFEHPGKPCPKRGGSKPRLTPEQRRQNERDAQRRWRQEHPDQIRRATNRANQKIKERVLRHYSGGDLKCACCGTKPLIFLTLDHTKGNGAEARRAAGNKGGVQYYRHLIRLGFPEGYSVLCWNCNAAKHIGRGVCPHVVANEVIF